MSDIIELHERLKRVEYLIEKILEAMEEAVHEDEGDNAQQKQFSKKNTE